MRVWRRWIKKVNKKEVQKQTKDRVEQKKKNIRTKNVSEETARKGINEEER